jgi:hypothetical protein
MKTQTAEEYLRKKVRLIRDKGTLKINQLSFILNHYTTTQIEALRERLENETTTYDFQGVGLVKIISIDVIRQTINEFLKEIND